MYISGGVGYMYVERDQSLSIPSLCRAEGRILSLISNGNRKGKGRWEE